MQIKHDPRLVLTAYDINNMYRNDGGRTTSVDIGDGQSMNISVDIETGPGKENFANNIIQAFLKDADVDIFADAIIEAARTSNSAWTNNEVEILVARLNEKFGTGTAPKDFIMSERFSSDAEDGDDEIWSSGWSNDEVEEFLDESSEEELNPDNLLQEGEEEDEISMLDSFDPADEVKQEAHHLLTSEAGMSDEFAMHVADLLRQNDLLKENE